MKRIFYACYYGLKHKKNIYQYIVNPLLKVSSVVELSPEYFQSRKIRYIVLDFDGVLASHGETKLFVEAEAWLKQITQVIPESHFALLSNKPFAKRLAYFQHGFPNISIVSGVPKKPYPEGLNKLVAHFRCTHQELALVDDRLLTGMLAVCLAGVQGIYIEQAYQNFEKRPIVEGFFSILRAVERSIFCWLEGKSGQQNKRKSKE